MLVLIDGHNLVAKMPDIRLDDPEDEEKLVVRLRQYRARTNRRVLVIFDSGGIHNPERPRQRGGLRVQYARPGVSADQLIISHLQKASNPQQIMVVTSDRAIQRAARQVRARVMSAADFVAELTFSPAEAAVADDVSLSEEEVAAWLELFNKKGD